MKKKSHTKIDENVTHTVNQGSIKKGLKILLQMYLKNNTGIFWSIDHCKQSQVMHGVIVD